MGSRALNALIATLLFVVVAVGIVAAAPLQPATTPADFDTTGFEIHVDANGSARWTVEHSRVLTNESEIQDFETFMAEFNGSQSEVAANFRERSNRIVDSASNALGRSMNATDFETAVSIQQLGQTRGVLELSFRWSNFARRTDGGYVVGDVFAGGLYILADQRLVIERDTDLVFREALPTPTSMAVPGNLTASTSVTWEGERQFADNRPFARLEPANGADLGTGPSPAGPGDQAMSPFVVLAGVIVALVAVSGGVLAYRSGYRPVGKGGDTAVETGSEPVSVPPAELEADEDRVLALLEENGGRMKQVEIVDQMEWSKSKVSMLLSEMEDEGTISKLRVGRENIISLSGNEPEAAGSPFDEE